MEGKRNFLLSSFVIGLTGALLLTSGCAGKYKVRTYPAGAKVYTRDIQTSEKKLVGLSPVQIPEDSRLGDVFFLVVEKENYKPKEVLVRASSGESLLVSTTLDPLTGDDLDAAGEGKDDQKPQGQPKKDDKKGDLEDLKLRVSLLENTVSFYKDAMFSERFKGNGQAKFQRDDNDKVVHNLFKAQQMVMNNKLAEASTLIDEVLSKDEYLSNGWLLKGSVNYLQKNYQAAKVAWEKCLKVDPYNKMAYVYLNKVYEKLGIQQMPPQPAQMRYPASIVEIDKRK